VTLRVYQDAEVADRTLSEPLPAGGADRKRPSANDTFPWDSFDSEWYLDHNYGTLRNDDRQIINRVADFFSAVDRRRLKHGIDVGTGTNLYPALTMLPLCSRITLRERAATNHRWLCREVDKFSVTWEPYWEQLAGRPLYKPIRDPRWAVHERTVVERGSIFDLPANTYEIGTMFFVAESITERLREFQRATRCFLRSLKPNAPFAAAFMRDSEGYEVNGVHFPAVAITEDDVRKCLDGEVARMNLDHIASTGLREGYDGMVLVTGTTTGKVVRR
jgi:hypothetical protein